MGEDVLYSGTVSAAMEGLALGIPSIALSFAGGDLRADIAKLDEQVEILVPLLRHLTSLPEFPEGTLLNVNLPPLSAAQIRGVRLTRLGRRVYSNSIQPMHDPWGRQIYWIGGGEISWTGQRGFGLPGGARRVRVGHAPPPRPDPYAHARRVGALVASPVGTEFRGARRRLVEVLQANGISDLAVLRAFEMTPRHLFVPTGVRHRAYEDTALPIGNGQTISQPTVHARYLQLLQLGGHERVLEVGTGSGYQTVLLAHLAGQVFSIERVAPLLDRARTAIRDSGVRNVSLLLGDGSIGWREYAPYDAILVSAAAPDIPQPLIEQLAEGGRLVAPRRSRRADAHDGDEATGASSGVTSLPSDSSRSRERMGGPTDGSRAVFFERDVKTGASSCLKIRSGTLLLHDRAWEHAHSRGVTGRRRPRIRPDRPEGSCLRFLLLVHVRRMQFQAPRPRLARKRRMRH